MILSYQDREKLRPKPPQPPDTAIVTAVRGNSVQLSIGQKWYRVDSASGVTVGQRVQIRKESGTFVIGIAGSGSSGGGSGDMTKAQYDPGNVVANAGGIPAYVAQHTGEAAGDMLVADYDPDGLVKDAGGIPEYVGEISGAGNAALDTRIQSQLVALENSLSNQMEELDDELYLRVSREFGGYRWPADGLRYSMQTIIDMLYNMMVPPGSLTRVSYAGLNLTRAQYSAKGLTRQAYLTWDGT